MTDGKFVDGSIWFYAPNKGAPIFFAVAFFISAVWHTWQCSRYKAWKIMGLHPVTCILFVGGFACREWGAFQYKDPNPFIASTSLIYLSPPLLELANYHALGRILYYVPYASPLNPGRTLTTFGFVSLIVEILNGLGVSWIANPQLGEDLVKVGHVLLQAGLVVQIVVIIAFCCTAGLFHFRCAQGGVLTRKTAIPLYTMYTSSLLIMIRCIYRTIEHFTVDPSSTKSKDGHVPTHDELNDMNPILRYEWYFYVFEATVLLLNEFLWNFFHPRRYLPEDYHVYLAQDGVTELQGPGWNDKRPLMLTLIDPFGWLDTCAPSKKKDEVPFWETNGFAGKGRFAKRSIDSSSSPQHGTPNMAHSAPYDGSRGGAYTSQTPNYSYQNPSAPQGRPAAAAAAAPRRHGDQRNPLIILMDPFGWVWKK